MLIGVKLGNAGIAEIAEMNYSTDGSRNETNKHCAYGLLSVPAMW